MLSVKQFTKEYISSCKKKIKADTEVFKKLASPTDAFENTYFNNMVLILETMFIHRMRGQEGKDGNPLNEVRMIANSILNHSNKLLDDSTIKYHAEKSILKIRLNQEINLSSIDFIKLSGAYFNEIEKKFS
jgi:hypothetical protein